MNKERHMKSKPLIFNIYALLFLVIALGIPVQISMLYGHGVQELGAIYNKLTFFNIAVIGVSLYNFYCCFSASANVKWSFPLAIGVVCFNNSIVLIYGNDFESYSVILATVAFIVLSAYFLMAHDTDIINQPKRQWWRIPKRFTLKEKVKLEVNDHAIDIGETFDISTTGAFIPAENLDHKIDVNSGDVFNFFIGEDQPIACKAKIVRKTPAKGHYPAGIGIQFIDLSLADKYKLQQKLFASRMVAAA